MTKLPAFISKLILGHNMFSPPKVAESPPQYFAKFNHVHNMTLMKLLSILQHCIIRIIYKCISCSLLPEDVHQSQTEELERLCPEELL